jgi:hypothetical protein
MVYQPMLELLAYLRANGFKTFIVSGGGIEFMRPWTERFMASRPNRSSAAASRQNMKSATASRCWFVCRRSTSSTTRRQAGRHPAAHRSTTDRRVRQFRRRFADAAVDDCRRRAALRAHRPPYRCRTRMGLRPQVAHRQARQGARRSASARLDGGGYEARLEDSLRSANKAMNHPSGRMASSPEHSFSPIDNEPPLRWQRKLGWSPAHSCGCYRC